MELLNTQLHRGFETGYLKRRQYFDHNLQKTPLWEYLNQMWNSSNSFTAPFQLRMCASECVAAGMCVCVCVCVVCTAQCILWIM